MSLELLRLNKNKNTPLRELTTMTIRAFPCSFQERLKGGFAYLNLCVFWVARSAKCGGARSGFIFLAHACFVRPASATIGRSGY